MEEKKNFFFIGDIIELKEDVKLIEGCCIKKASDEQISHVKPAIDAFVGLFWMINKYEIDNSTNRQTEKKNWSYSVLEYSNYERDKYHLSNILPRVMKLSDLGLNLLFNCHYAYGSYSFGYNPLRSANFFIDNSDFHPVPIKISKKSVDSVKKVYSLLVDFNSFNQYDIIEKAISDYIQVSNISKSSPFKILSYFSILEWLLTTYKPRSKNTIVEQLKSKLNYLNKCFEDKVSIKKYFGTAVSFEVFIEYMYMYRNDIAHGNRIKFNDELFVNKGSQNNVDIFLDEIVKSVLIYSISNPQEIINIKK